MKAEEMTMTNDQKQLAVALSGCRYAPGTSGKRFSRTLSWAARENKPLSFKQIRYMYLLACQKRNQLGQKMFDLIPRDIWVEYKKQHRSIK